MYTVVSERRSGSFMCHWMSETSRYDAYRGHFGYKGEPAIYRTADDRPFCVIVQTEAKLVGWFEHQYQNLVQPALEAIGKLP
jgi:hypothetical protein